MSNNLDTRHFLKKMRDAKKAFDIDESIFVGGNNGMDENMKTQPQKEMSMRDMLKITRKLNEEEENKKTAFDQSKEEEKFRNFFKDLNVNIEFIDLEVYDNLIFWGGTVDGVVQFVYKVTPYEDTSGPQINYIEGNGSNNEETENVANRIETYYNIFYKYWRNNVLNM